ncbi:MAG TPA: hypothetical protein VF681_09655 [Abditibacteriaceae bacterium]|jgi:hypothetical protein
MSDDIIDMDDSGNVMPREDAVRGGRKGGSLAGLSRNKKFSAFIAELLERNQGNMERWLMEVADGKPTRVIEAQPELGIPGGVIPGLDPDPKAALEILNKLAEYAEPKQGRMLIGNDPDNPFAQPVLNVTIGGKKVDVNMGSTAPDGD